MKLWLKELFSKEWRSGMVVYVVLSALLVSDGLVARGALPDGLQEWFRFCLDCFPWTLLAMIPLWIIGGRCRYVYAPLIALAVVFESIEWFVRVNFHMLLLGDWIGIVMGSSMEEMKWFISNYLGITFLVCLCAVIILASGFVWGVWQSRYMKLSRTTIVAALLSFSTFVYGTSLTMNKFEVFDRLTIVKVVEDSIRSFSDYRMLSQMRFSPRFPDSVCLNTNGLDNVIGVVVLGESATRNHWGLYGYKRDTTPCLSARRDRLICYSDVVTPSPGTAEAMRYIFTTRTLERRSDFRYTMAQVMRKAGLDVSLYSNQERWGQWDGDETFDFAGCEPMCFMGETDATNRFDEILLPYLKNAVSQSATNRVIFIHLNGSHQPPDTKYPQDCAQFSGDKSCKESVNHYDNSIWYTDRVLEGVIRILEETKQPCWLMYLSDHGETPSSRGWRVATDSDLWEVPLVFWFSKEFRDLYPQRVMDLELAKDLPLQSDQLFYGILKFSGLRNLDVDAKEIFTDPAFVSRRERLIQNGQCVYHAQ